MTVCRYVSFYLSSPLSLYFPSLFPSLPLLSCHSCLSYHLSSLVSLCSAPPLFFLLSPLSLSLDLSLSLSFSHSCLSHRPSSLVSVSAPSLLTLVSLFFFSIPPNTNTAATSKPAYSSVSFKLKNGKFVHVRLSIFSPPSLFHSLFLSFPPSHLSLPLPLLVSLPPSPSALPLSLPFPLSLFVLLLGTVY